MATNDESTAIHLKLLTDISDSMEVDSREYESFIEHMKRIIPKGVLASKKTLLKKLEAMAGKGKLGVGNYEHLKKIAVDSDNGELLEMINEAEQKLKTIQTNAVSVPEASPSDSWILQETKTTELGNQDIGAKEDRGPSISSNRKLEETKGILNPKDVDEDDGGPSTYKKPKLEAFAKVLASTSSTTSTKDESSNISKAFAKELASTSSTTSTKDESRNISKDQEQKHSASEWISQDTNGHSVTKRYTDIDNSKDLRDICILHGRTSQEVLEACKSIRLKIIVCSRSFKDVLPMYKPVDPYNIVFVVFCEKESNRSTELPLSVESFDVEYRTIGEYRHEDKDIPIERQLFSEKEERKNLTDILKKTSSHFMHEHSNLNIISASPVKSKAFALKEHRFERKPCIVFYVCLKGYIPIQEEEFPSQLGSYETDVREGAFTLYNDTEPFAQRLKLGCSIGEDQTNRLFGGSWGTLGAFVDLRNKKVGCITSAHVLLDQMKLFGCKNSKIDLLDTNAATTIYQPAPSLVPLTADKQPFGRVTSVVYNTGGNGVTGVEAGLITITDPNRYPDDGQFPKIAEDFNEDNQLNFKSGKIFRNIPENIGQFAFYKYGAKTGLTRGAFRLQAGAVRTSTMHVRDQCELHGQIEVCSVDKKPFAEPGDSGSLVLIALESDINDLHAIGILTGGDTVGSKFYITPIWEVLNALELPLQLKNFDGQLPMETDDSNEGNDSKSSEIVAMKKNIKAVQKNLDKEIKTLNHTVKTEVGNVDKKVDTLGSEMKEKLDTILEAILKK